MMRKDFNTNIMDLDNQIQYSSDSNSQSSSTNSNYFSPHSHSPVLQYTTLESVRQQPAPQQQQQHIYHQQTTYIPNLNMQHVTAPMYNTASSQPKLTIIEEPADKFRFRYSSEMHGTHGSLMGEHTKKNQKSYPQIRLEGYQGKAVIRCTLYQEKLTNPCPHSHSLVIRKNDNDECDPHYFEVDGSKDFTTIKCQGMGIIHTAKKDIRDTLCRKLMTLAQKDGDRNKNEDFVKKAEMEAKSMNLNQVRLCFEALRQEPNGTFTAICEPVYSKPINNMKSALTGEVKICRLSAAVSSAEGGDDLFLLVEKVNKKNIKVRFFEEDKDGNCVWQDWGRFSETDVHHQYAIALRTPPYKDKDIEEVVDVKIQLLRETDRDVSEPMPFKYKPRHAVSSRKRRRLSACTMVSGDIPRTFDYNIASVSSSEGSDGMSISTEYNKETILNDLAGQPQLSSTEFNLCQKDLPGDSMELSAFISVIGKNSDELRKMMDPNILNNFDQLEPELVVTDGAVSRPIVLDESAVIKQATNFVSKLKSREWSVEKTREKVTELLSNYEKGTEGNFMNNLISTENTKLAIAYFKILETINFYEPLNRLEGTENPLFLACQENKHIFIRTLLSFNCDPNTTDSETGDTALHICADGNFLDCARTLIRICKEKGIKLNINVANFDGLTCLHKAIRRGYLEMVKLFIEEGEASPKLAVSKTGNNSLMLAVESKQQEIVEYLIRRSDVNINAKNSSGNTALELAKSNDPNIARVIMLNLKITDPPVDIKEESEEDSDSQSGGENVEYVYWDDRLKKRLSEAIGDRWVVLAEAMECGHLKLLLSSSAEFFDFIAKNEMFRSIGKLKLSEFVSKMEGSTAQERNRIDQIIGIL